MYKVIIIRENSEMNVLYGAQSEGLKNNNYLTRERGNHRENLSGLIYSRNKYILKEANVIL